MDTEHGITNRSRNRRPLTVLLVGEDRSFLRHLSKALHAFGYEVREAADRAQALAAVDAEHPALVLLDAEPAADSALELCRAIGLRKAAAPSFTLLLVDSPSPELVIEALEAGVDDFLTRPVVYGELLARLRAAARVLEFERRLRQQGGRDTLTGHLSRVGSQAELPAACVLVDLDHLGRINRLYGQPTGDVAIRAAADHLNSSLAETEQLYSLGAGRFCIWMPGVSEAEAAERAEAARAALESTEVTGFQEPLQFTASFGVAGSRENENSPEATLHRGEQALLAAKQSGRNCVFRFREFDGDANAWSDFAAGKLFERTVARDVMTPSTLTLRADDSAVLAADLLGRSRQIAIPVVGEDGKLTGLILGENVIETAYQGPSEVARVAGIMTIEVPHFEENTPFADLCEFFTQDSRSLIVITNEGKPTGLVTPDNLAALSQPLTEGTFTSREAVSEWSDYLMVPDLSPLADG